MSSFIKGKFLEFALRQIMFRCGFTSVKSDGLYIWERSPQLFINGRGASHDADILVDPPVQMPFTYPSRILFECKAYSKDIGVTIIRNAAGLRQDINDFEIVTENSLRKRQNNRRADVAIHNRKRHVYQVGVASISGFTKPAIEFAANNKIPLFSLPEAFKESRLLELLYAIPPNIEEILGDRFNDFKSKLSDKYSSLIEDDNFQIFGNFESINPIINELKTHLNRIHVGVLESGELIFITKDAEFNSQFVEEDILNKVGGNNLATRIHWHDDNPNLWTLEFPGKTTVTYSFYLPESIARNWAEFEEQKSAAIDLKKQKFSRIFVFSKTDRDRVPFNILTLDQKWIQDLKNR